MFVEEAAKKSEHLKRENDRLRNLSADLSQQVWCKHYLFSQSVYQFISLLVFQPVNITSVINIEERM